MTPIKEIYPDVLNMRESEGYNCMIFDGGSFEKDYEDAVKYVKKNKGQIYTMVDGDDGKTHYLKGVHQVNRFAFCVLKKLKELV